MARSGAGEGFVQVPTAIVRDTGLSIAARLLYGVLRSYCDADGYCYPGRARLGRDMGLGVRQIGTLLAELRGAGLVDWRRGNIGRTNRYRVAMPERADRQSTSPSMGSTLPTKLYPVRSRVIAKAITLSHPSDATALQGLPVPGELAPEVPVDDLRASPLPPQCSASPPSPKRTTWLSLFLETWHRCTGGYLSPGRAARVLRPLVLEHGEQVVDWALERYCYEMMDKGKAEYMSVNKLAETFDYWRNENMEEYSKLPRLDQPQGGDGAGA